jgi:hypothetical protein
LHGVPPSSNHGFLTCASSVKMGSPALWHLTRSNNWWWRTCVAANLNLTTLAYFNCLGPMEHNLPQTIGTRSASNGQKFWIYLNKSELALTQKRGVRLFFTRSAKNLQISSR